MMESECLVEAKEYKVSVIQWLSSITIWGLPVIPWLLLGIITAIIARFLLHKYPAWDSKKKDSKGHPNKPRHEKWFYAWIIGVAVLGGTWAFFLPIAINSGFGKDDDGAALRQALIYTTGGILGVITLGETHRKNTLEKDKNDQDHTRQVHAERRSRYTKAVEHLFNENISVRLGGVYALVGLADEWLTDEKTLRTDKERRKEGQVIINTLCSYIRSSFNLASKTEDLSRDQTPEDYEGGDQQFTKDRAKLREEKELRLAILEAIKNRLDNRNRSINQIFGKVSWSDFDYDFSNAIFFYPIGFTNSYFGASSKFSGAEFIENANFSGAEFTEDANFSEAKFTGYAGFSEAEFTSANFSQAEFTKDTIFLGAKFTGSISFSGAKFTKNANFSKAEFTKNANFSQAEFTKDTIFLGAKFTSANFSGAKFTSANFSGAKFTSANFSGAKFTSANFSQAEFTKKANFFKATFEEKPQFEYALGNKTYKARFSCKADPEDYNFEVSPDSHYKIETEEKEYDGVKFIIPKGTELYDPRRTFRVGKNDGN